MEQPRDINMELVEAYMARRALDYLVGFTLSPLLWRKLPGARSAGRVQSVALRLLCDREDEILAFQKKEYWDVKAQLCVDGKNTFGVTLVARDGKKLEKFDLADKATAEAACEQVRQASLAVLNVNKKPLQRHPNPPFITSTLQQEASRKLGFSARKTMTVAQKLYEGIDLGDGSTGLITYMRTDGVQTAPEAVETMRTQIKDSFGETYLPSAPRIYKSKAKNAQEAHEAIRPTNIALSPESLKAKLPKDEYRLYELIWKRALASQMESARFERTTVEVGDESLTLRATGSVLLFDGFLCIYQEAQDDKAEEDKDKRLPQITPESTLETKEVTATQHFTEPPPRYTEASLVKHLESLGIGRPSTYASILSVLREREYAHIENKRFICNDRGRVVTSFLCDFFPRYVEYDFTALLEEKLDRISAGELKRKTVLEDFWHGFTTNIDSVKDMPNTDILERLNQALSAFVFPMTPEGKAERSCPTCEEGILSIKTGRYGAFVGCSAYPTCTYTRPLFAQDKTSSPASPKLLGTDPHTQKNIFFKQGPYGPYVEREPDAPKKKPKRMGIPPSLRENPVDLDMALRLLSLPRDLGLHPESGKPVTASIGRYGPYVAHEGTYARLSGPQEVFEVGLNRAVDLIAQKRKKRGGKTKKS